MNRRRKRLSTVLRRFDRLYFVNAEYRNAARGLLAHPASREMIRSAPYRIADGLTDTRRRELRRMRRHASA